ncbi:MAG: NDP-sugar synthase, partial [Acidobacteriota bacterium]|nr:NDP-sugar synthase [Acidobacteriota bacterium]
FIVINGKIITDIDLTRALATHRQQQALATLVLKPNQKFERFSEVKITGDGRIAKFAGFPASQSQISNPKSQISPLMFTGIHLLEPEIFEYIPRGVFSDSVRDVYPKAMADGRIIAAHVAAAESSWHELSTIERYLEISLEFLAREGRDVVMDEGCNVASDAQVSRSVLWKRVRVESGAKLTHCIVGDGVTIPVGSEFSRAVIVRADLAFASDRPEKALSGAVAGDNLVVPFG